MTASEARDIEIMATYSFKPITERQADYYEQMMRPDSKIVFGHGASGTGKSIVALKAALDLLSTNQVKKILIYTEACEVGHKIGHLPGDTDEKLNPYFQSVRDNLFEITGQPEVIKEMIKGGTIEFKAINFIRGVTFRDSAVILDEAQNISKPGMKAFLTRVGKGSRIFINGDESQVDDDRLRNGNNGLADAMKRLRNKSESILFTQFQKSDVVRDGIIPIILDAYDDA